MSVFIQSCPLQTVVAEITEGVFVLNPYLSSIQVYGFCPYILILISHFIGVRIELTVGTYNAVAVEVVV